MGWEGPATLRHFQLWQAWFAAERREPDLVCQYIMQLTAELAAVTCWLGVRKKSDMPTTLDDLRLKFVDAEPAPDPIPVSSSRKRRRHASSPEKKKAAQWSKMKWHTVLGGAITVRNPDGTLTLPDGTKVPEAEYNAARTAHK